MRARFLLIAWFIAGVMFAIDIIDHWSIRFLIGDGVLWILFNQRLVADDLEDFIKKQGGETMRRP